MISREFALAVAPSKNSRHWVTQRMQWSEFCEKLRNPNRGFETHEAFMRMKKSEQDELKDRNGGYVGGAMTGGRRLKENVLYRELVTLDMDAMPQDGMANVLGRLAGLGLASVVYSTYKHDSRKPRLRVIVLMDRPMQPEEYQPIARMIANEVGLSYCDRTTFDLNRLMYWANCSCDSEYVCRVFDGRMACADEWLAMYGPDNAWKDARRWPLVPGEDEKIADEAKRKAADPLTKNNLVGAFCRTYTIPQAIEKYLSDVYLPTDDPDRWTYALGSTTAGAILYQDGLFLYSHHGTDPCGGKLVNAWDLVRTHLFGAYDEGDGKGVNSESYKRMVKLAQDDFDVKRTRVAMKDEEVRSDFSAETDTSDLDWKARMRGKGVDDTYEETLTNFAAILRNDPALSGIRYDELSCRLVAHSRMPWPRAAGTAWTKSDTASLRSYIDKTYEMYSPTKLDDALLTVSMERKYHPIRDYLDFLPAWDGVKRADTLLIDYFGAEDSVYTREAMRKTLCAAVARVYEPGKKFDTVLVLRGPQGIGKSTFFDRLAVDWFSDSLTMNDMRDKTGAEKLQGYWIVEMGELVGMRKAEAEVVKSFISRRNDSYRAAYAPTVEDHPRQAIIVGTTNAEHGFLRDVTGNRRFWPVDVTGDGEDVFDALDAETVAQIWAEAKLLYEAGEPLYLSGEALGLAARAQEAAAEQDDRTGMVQVYLDRLLPEDWDRKSLPERRGWLADPFNEGTVRRDCVTRQEIWCECFGGELSRLERGDSAAIQAIMQQIDGWESSNERRYSKMYGQQRVFMRKDRA